MDRLNFQYLCLCWYGSWIFVFGGYFNGGGGFGIGMGE